LDKFPEAFRRFEQVVNVKNIRSFSQLLLAFSLFAGKNWKGSRSQILALAVEARKRGIPVLVRQRAPSITAVSWRHEIVMVRGKRRGRFRDLKSGRFIRKP
jgi:hypothetical protein